eukprot:CAMPEP_0184696402 /NCGR_PEP_ID=MMETSP0313-20130426/3715_1 /TAXON_ID=2792 /ORGANISM="Porphyridium aerugineum, Strain SAG 1380-2" /LENGTH=900 /DNA_ID=CAMNT_0027155029 /DNA_START=310 /DNA_END=3012 /DNA_ORIENTATION=+
MEIPRLSISDEDNNSEGKLSFSLPTSSPIHKYGSTNQHGNDKARLLDANTPMSAMSNATPIMSNTSNTINSMSSGGGGGSAPAIVSGNANRVKLRFMGDMQPEDHGTGTGTAPPSANIIMPPIVSAPAPITSHVSSWGTNPSASNANGENSNTSASSSLISDPEIGKSSDTTLPVPTLTTHKSSLGDIFEDDQFEHAVGAWKNSRPYMEDYYYAELHRNPINNRLLGHFAVFDGHGGTMASEFISENFLEILTSSKSYPTDMPDAFKYACAESERKLVHMSKQQKKYAGTTGIMVAIDEKNITCCNVGDSRAVLSRSGMVVPLSEDHSPLNPAEVKRIKAAGGFVDARGVNAYISMTRSFGDLDCKDHKHMTFPALTFTADLLIAEPEIKVVNRSSADEFIIIASDGVWCRISNERAVKVAGDILRRTGGDAKEVTKHLAAAAMSAGSDDNITVIVIVLNRPQCVRDVTVHGGSFFKNFGVSGSRNEGSASVHGTANRNAQGEGVRLANLLSIRTPIKTPTRTPNDSSHGGDRVAKALKEDSEQSQGTTPSKSEMSVAGGEPRSSGPAVKKPSLLTFSKRGFGGSPATPTTTATLPKVESTGNLEEAERRSNSFSMSVHPDVPRSVSAGNPASNDAVAPLEDPSVQTSMESDALSTKSSTAARTGSNPLNRLSRRGLFTGAKPGGPVRGNVSQSMHGESQAAKALNADSEDGPVPRSRTMGAGRTNGVSSVHGGSEALLASFRGTFGIRNKQTESVNPAESSTGATSAGMGDATTPEISASETPEAVPRSGSEASTLSSSNVGVRKGFPFFGRGKGSGNNSNTGSNPASQPISLPESADSSIEVEFGNFTEAPPDQSFGLFRKYTTKDATAQSNRETTSSSKSSTGPSPLLKARKGTWKR